MRVYKDQPIAEWFNNEVIISFKEQESSVLIYSNSFKLQLLLTLEMQGSF